MRPLHALIACLCATLSAGAAAELRTYDVAPRHRQELYEALRDVLYHDSPQIRRGHVEMLPTGQILIDTSPEMHGQVAAVLDAISERQTEPAPRVTLRYWAVLGTREPLPDAGTPAILGDVLAELERVHGDLSFRVAGNATLATESGQEGSLEGRPLSVVQQTYVQGTALNADISITFEYLYAMGTGAFATQQHETQRVELETTMQAGDFVVLGENTIETRADAGLNGTLFYIVQWPEGE